MTEAPQKPGGKGRPTPKRSEAQKARKKPIVAPKGRDALKAQRAEAAAARRTMRQALVTGDEKNYPPNAAGPERALVRDVIDARRSFGWVAIPGWLLGLVLTMTPVPAAQAAASLMFPFLIAVVVGDAIVARRTVRNALTERWPEGTKIPRGTLVWYGVSRNMLFRRSRRPRPRVSPGS